MSAGKKDQDNYYRRAQLEALIREDFPDIKVFETDDGREFFVHHPQAQPDELVETLEPMQSQIKVAEAMVNARNGEGAWADFKAAGGQSMYVLQAFTKEAERVQSRIPGSGSPTT